MRVLVCGGRTYSNSLALTNALDTFHLRTPITHLIHGAARGADSLAATWAHSRSIPTTAFPADWARHGRSAGHIRNAQMLSEGNPAHVIAFPGGPGTAGMISLTRKANIPLTLIP